MLQLKGEGGGEAGLAILLMGRGGRTGGEWQQLLLENSRSGSHRLYYMYHVSRLI